MEDHPTTLKFSRRNLPHWLVADCSYFVTLRLYGSLPKAIVREMKVERETLRSKASLQTYAELSDQQRRNFRRIEKVLDAACEGDHQWLKKPQVADMLMDQLGWFQREKGWLIYAGVIMSNHIHLLMRNERGRSGELLDDLTHFKRFTAKQANGVLGRTGAFWSRESFDHWIRTPEKFEATVRYIANNPVKAGLVGHWTEWQWIIIDETVKELLE